MMSQGHTAGAVTLVFNKKKNGSNHVDGGVSMQVENELFKNTDKK